MTANDKQDNINIPAEALPDGALAQVTGGGSVFVQPYSKGDWVKLRSSGITGTMEYPVGFYVSDVLGSNRYEITEFTYHHQLCRIISCQTNSYSLFEIARPKPPPSWAALAMEYYETHKGGAL